MSSWWGMALITLFCKGTCLSFVTLGPVLPQRTPGNSLEHNTPEERLHSQPPLQLVVVTQPDSG